MIRGEKINLRVTQEKDLDTLFHFLSDIENRGKNMDLEWFSILRDEMEKTG